MKKQKKFSDLNAADARHKRDELLKELAAFRLSLDVSAVKTEGGVAGLRRDLKTISRKLSQSVANKVSGGV